MEDLKRERLRHLASELRTKTSAAGSSESPILTEAGARTSRFQTPCFPELTGIERTADPWFRREEN